MKIIDGIIRILIYILLYLISFAACLSTFSPENCVWAVGVALLVVSIVSLVCNLLEAFSWEVERWHIWLDIISVLVSAIIFVVGLLIL